MYQIQISQIQISQIQFPNMGSIKWWMVGTCWSICWAAVLAPPACHNQPTQSCLDCVFHIFLYSIFDIYFLIVYLIYFYIFIFYILCIFLYILAFLSFLGHPVFVWEEISWFCKKGKGEPFVEIILEIGGVACLPGNKKLVGGKTEPLQEKSLLATISLFVFATSTRPLNNNETKIQH